MTPHLLHRIAVMLLPLAIASAQTAHSAETAIDGLFSNATGKIQVRANAYSESPSRGDLRSGSTEDASLTLESTLDWKTWYRFDGGARFDVAGWFEYGSPHGHRWTGGFEPWQDDASESRPAVLNEFYVSLPVGDFDLSAGKTFLRNTMAGLYSPADRYTPADYNNPTEAKDMGVWQVRGDYHTDHWTATVALLPVFQPSKFPIENSRWSLNEAESIIGVPLPIGLPKGSLSFDRDLPNEAANLFASLRTRQQGWDAFVSAYYGYSRDPVFAIGPSPGPGTAQITMEYIKGLDLSAGLSTTRGAFEWHTEALYYNPENDSDDTYIKGVWGFTYRPEGLPGLLGCNQIAFSLDYAHEWIIEEQNDARYFLSSEPFRFGRNTLLAEAYFEIDVRNELTLTLIQDFEDRTDSIVRAKYTHRFDNGLSVGLVGEVFSGEGLYFGDWSANDRLTLFAEFDF